MKRGAGGVNEAWGHSTTGWDGVGAASNAWKQESANEKQPKKKKKTYTSCAGAWADARGGAVATRWREWEAGQ